MASCYALTQMNAAEKVATIRGLTLVGAAWDVHKNCLRELPKGARMQRLANVNLSIEKVWQIK